MDESGVERQSARVMYWEEIGRLWQTADQPSSRELHRASGRLNTTLSHTTFANALKRGKLPSWHVVKTLVALLDGNAAYVQRLWNAAKAEERAVAPGQAVEPQTTAVPDVAGPKSPDFTSWRIEHDWRTAPPVIRLLDTAVKSGIDPTRLLLQIAPDDPAGTAPAVALVADNDLHRAAEVIAYVASTGRNRGYEIFIGASRIRPLAALRLARILHDRHGLRGESLLIPVLYGYNAARENADRARRDPLPRTDAEPERRSAAVDAAYYVVEIYHDQGRDELAETLVHTMLGTSAGSPEAPVWTGNLTSAAKAQLNVSRQPVNPPAWMPMVDADIVFHALCDVIEEMLHHPRYAKYGADLLVRIIKRSYRVATAMFANLIVRDTDLRRGPAGASNLALLAETAPTPTALLFMRCLWDSSIKHLQLNSLLCQLAVDVPATATGLACVMLERSVANVTLVLGETENNVGTAELILALYSRRPDPILEILHRWTTHQGDIFIYWAGRVLQAKLAPIGGVVLAMLHAHPATTIDMLLQLAESLPLIEPTPSVLHGLDEPLLRHARDLVREHAGARWAGLRKFV